MSEPVRAIEGLAKGSEGVGVDVAALFRRLRPALLRFFERRSFSRADAEDLTQEAFIKLVRLERPEEIRQPDAFLFQVAANVIRDRLRREVVRCYQNHVPIDETTDSGEGPSEESVYEGTESLERLMITLGQLKPRSRSVFLLHKYEGLGYAEIAQRFGVSVSAVEKHMILALSHLHKNWRLQP